jgi:hypothetical protein
LRILDEREEHEADEARAVGQPFAPSLVAPYRWRDWAAPDGYKRVELQMGVMGGFFQFVNGELLPYLRKLKEHPNATSRQKVISEIMSGVERVRIDTEKNTLDVLDRVHQNRPRRGRAVPYQRDRICSDQAQATRRLRPVVHCQPAWWRVHNRRSRRQDQPALLHQGPPDRANSETARPRFRPFISACSPDTAQTRTQQCSKS